MKVNAMATVKESVGAMLAGGQRCALVVDENDLLEGIVSSSDLQREVLRATEESVFSDLPIIVEVCFHFLLLSMQCHLIVNELNLNIKILSLLSYRPIVGLIINKDDCSFNS